MSTNTACRVRLISIKEATARTGLGRTRLTALLDRAAITSVKLLDRRLVVVESLEHFITLQRTRAAQDGRVRVPPPDAAEVEPRGPGDSCEGLS